MSNNLTAVIVTPILLVAALVAILMIREAVIYLVENLV